MFLDHWESDIITRFDAEAARASFISKQDVRNIIHRLPLPVSARQEVKEKFVQNVNLKSVIDGQFIEVTVVKLLVV